MQQPDSAVVYGRTPDCLAAIREPATELVLWERAPLPGLTRWLEALPPGALPNGRLLVAVGDIEAAVASLVDASAGHGEPMQRVLADDVARLARLFAETIPTPRVDIRLEVVRDDACWKYHRDCVPARLITTYMGPGTEWVRPAFGSRAIKQQSAFPGPIEHFGHHAVGLFKGSCAPPASGIVHRSPPIAGSGGLRLLLCLNLETAASPNLWAG